MNRPAPDLRLYFVTDPVLCAARGVVAAAEAAAAGGATIVQLRDPGAKGRALADLARALVAALAPLGVPLIVNDRADVAHAAGAAGVHLGDEDLTPAQARAILGPEAWIGLSLAEPARFGEADPGLVDYVGTGAVRGTATKADAGEAIGLRGLAACCAASRVPVVAIGGLGPGLAAPCVAAGAAGVAVISAIASAPDPRAAAAALRAEVDGALADAALVRAAFTGPGTARPSAR